MEAGRAPMNCWCIVQRWLINPFIVYSVQISRHTRVETSYSHLKDNLECRRAEFGLLAAVTMLNCSLAFYILYYKCSEESELEISHSITHSCTQDGFCLRKVRYVWLGIEPSTFMSPAQQISVFYRSWNYGTLLKQNLVCFSVPSVLLGWLLRARPLRSRPALFVRAPDNGVQL